MNAVALTGHTVNALLTLVVMGLVLIAWGVWRIAGLMQEIADGFRRDLDTDEEINAEISAPVRLDDDSEPIARDSDKGGAK